MNNPEDFGVEVADYIVAEPLGSIGLAAYDQSGVGWWGDPPFPLLRTHDHELDQ